MNVKPPSLILQRHGVFVRADLAADPAKAREHLLAVASDFTLSNIHRFTISAIPVPLRYDAETESWQLITGPLTEGDTVARYWMASA